MSNIGFIYKISNTVDNDIYVGSTKQTIHQRFKCHLSNTKRDNLKSLTLYEKMEAIGKDKFKVELLETVQFDDKFELYARENFYIKELKPPLNMRPAPVKDYNNYENHKEARLQWCKEYYQINKEHIIERVHQYAENNKEKIKERGKKYREEHEAEIKEKKYKKCVCECGLEYTHAHQSRHLRTKAHLENLKSKEHKPTIEEFFK